MWIFSIFDSFAKQMGWYHESAEPETHVWHWVSTQWRECPVLFWWSRSRSLRLEISCPSSKDFLKCFEFIQSLSLVPTSNYWSDFKTLMIFQILSQVIRLNTDHSFLCHKKMSSISTFHDWACIHFLKQISFSFSSIHFISKRCWLFNRFSLKPSMTKKPRWQPTGWRLWIWMSLDWSQVVIIIIQKERKKQNPAMVTSSTDFFLLFPTNITTLDLDNYGEMTIFWTLRDDCGYLTHISKEPFVT